MIAGLAVICASAAAVALAGPSSGASIGRASATTARVPTGVHAIEVTSARPGARRIVSRLVTGPVKVRRIASWIDAMPAVKPPLVIACPGLRAGEPAVTFESRGARGRSLAVARLIDYGFTSGPCNPVSFEAGGHRWTRLVGGDFLRRVQRLLGVSFN
jgi:hypothetical protein